MSKEKVYTKFNSYRKPKFNLRTEVSIENGKKNVYKTSVYEEGEEFIQHIYNSYKELSKLELPFEINKCELVDKRTLRFEYIEGKSLLKEIEEIAMSNDLDKFVNKFKEFEELLNKLPSKKDKLGKEFEEVFGSYEEDKEYDLLLPGILDLNLDNIIRDKDGTLHLIDYEWCFDFAIPKRYVLYRTVYYSLLYLGSFKTKKWNLKNLEKELGLTEKEIKKYFKWENDFQKYVTNREGDYIKTFDSRLQINDNPFKQETLLTNKITYDENLNKYKIEISRLEDAKKKDITQKQILKDVHNLPEEEIQKLCYYSPYDKFLQLTDETSKKEEQIQLLNNILISKENLIDYLKNSLHTQQEDLSSLTKKINELNETLVIKNNLLNNIYESDIYKFLKFLRKNPDPLSSLEIARKGILKGFFHIIQEIGKKTLTVFRIILKTLYKYYPIKKHKRLLRYKLYSSSRLPILLGTKKFSDYKNSFAHVILEDGNSTMEIPPLTHLNKSLAVHLHLYYEDLLEEFYNYLLNIPYTFDLYVSTNNHANIKKIKRKFKKILNVNKVFVEITENKGRDYGPMFVLFRERLKNYDYLYHIHSKKSLRTGYDNSEWRHYLLDAILGSEEQVMYCFQLMENHNVSQIFADTYKDVPLWANTWLGEIPLAEKLYGEFGVKVFDSYLDFSAGSMFILKTESIKLLMDRKWKWEDFEEEMGQDRGTVAYVLERGITNFLQMMGHNFSAYDIKTKSFRINNTTKNIDEYSLKTRDSALNYLSGFDIISFDIFDTLITRNIYYPDDVFRLIEENVTKLGFLKKKTFLRLRKKSEENVREKKKFLNDCSIDEIYLEFEKLSKLKKSEVEQIKELEINTEINLAVPRRDMQFIFKSLLEMNKVILLVSDMYLTEKNIRKILTKCGYENFYDLIVSSEIGLRKDNETMYEYLYKKYDSDSIIHVGDNESSDIHNLVRMEKPCYYVAQGRKLFEISNFNLDIDPSVSLDDSLVWGTIVNSNLFNSPFSLNESDKTGLIKDLYSYGYSVLGPLFLYFFIWLLNSVKENETLLFVSREGYYLQKICELIEKRINNSKLDKINNIYFLTSRRALTVANIQNLSDIEEIMQRNYDNNTLYELFYNRLGIEISLEQDRVINLPDDFNLVMKIAKEYFPQIRNNALREKRNYMKYLDSVLPTKDFLSVVDLGYSGTAQFELSKLINKKIGGYYFCISKNKKPLSIGLPIKSCFNKSIYENNLDSNVLYKYSMLLEAFLTAPEGQLVRFVEATNNSEEVIPDFLPVQKDLDKRVKEQEEIYTGISDFINKIIDLRGEDILQMKLSKESVLNNFEHFIKEEEADKGKNLFDRIANVEDLYCGEKSRNVMDICINNRHL